MILGGGIGFDAENILPTLPIGLSVKGRERSEKFWDLHYLSRNETTHLPDIEV